MKRWMLTLFLMFSVPAQAQLVEQILPTPAGTLAWVLPEGYCGLSGPGGAALTSALDQVAPPPRRVAYARFLACDDRRRVLDDREWPLRHGWIQVEPVQAARQNFLELNDQLRATQRGLLSTVAQSPLARSAMLHMMAPGLNIDGFLPQHATHLLLGDLRQPLRQRWEPFLEAVRERSKSPRFVREGFVLGRDQVAVWWAGAQRAGGGRVVAVVMGTTFVQDLAVTIAITRPFEGPNTFDMMRGDLLPTLWATLKQNS